MNAPRIATTITRTLLRLYPSSVRREIGESLIGDVRRRAQQQAASGRSALGIAFGPALGGSIGMACAAVASRVLQGLLYETSALSPTTYVAALLLLTIVAVGAAWSPARRAARVSPMTVLREG